MGCDIHLYAERSQTIKNEEKWINCDHWSYNPYFTEEEGSGEQKITLEPIYYNRNYTLFGMLAGVRKHRYDIPTVCKPKGLPKDISEITKAEADYWEGDGHSHSYLTYKELEDFRMEKACDSICIKELLDKMEERMKDVLCIFHRDATEEEKSKFRIVFWFDN